MSETMPRLRKKSHFLLETEFLRLTVIDDLNTFEYLIMIFLYQLLSPKMALVIEIAIGDPPNILDQILPQAVCQSLYIVGLPQLLHQE